MVTTAEQAPEILRNDPGLQPGQILVEPRGRNTAPCIALAVRVLRARLGTSIDGAPLVVLPADHHVEDVPGFRRLLRAAQAYARATNAIVTLGIEPDHPATGYGYLERGDTAVAGVPGDEGVAVFPALRFVEKPNAERARAYLDTGRFLWNAGIFVMSVGRIAAELERHCPATWEALAPVEASLSQGNERAAVAAASAAYARIESAPIDIAVMEKVGDLRVVPADVGWTDLGSWRAVYGIAPKDAHDNAVTGTSGPPLLVDVKRSLVWSEGLPVGVIGMTDIAVIATPHGVLVCPLERAEEVRDLVRRLEERTR